MRKLTIVIVKNPYKDFFCPMKTTKTTLTNQCYHCGDPCGKNPVEYDEKEFAIVGQSTKHMYRLGDEVAVKVKHTDLERKHLDFSLVSH